jgi:hypothetical protein
MQVVNTNLKSKVLAEPVLVGRENELQELQFFLSSAAEGKGTTVFVSGAWNCVRTGFRSRRDDNRT